MIFISGIINVLQELGQELNEIGVTLLRRLRELLLGSRENYIHGEIWHYPQTCRRLSQKFSYHTARYAAGLHMMRELYRAFRHDIRT